MGGLAPLLVEALAGGGIACVRIDERALNAADLQRSIAACQEAGVAVLLFDPTVAGGGDADGIHLDHAEDDDDAALFARVRQARAGDGRGIVGAGGLRTRHHAMSAGELDVDYVMFGEPGAEDVLPAAEAVLERVRWWAEIFTVPCVAYARSLEDVRGLVDAGADFVALREAVWDDPRGPRAAIEDVLAIVAGAAAVS